MLKFNIETEPEKYFHQLVEILGIFPPLTKLRKRQREIFAEILIHFHKYRNETDDVSTRLVFDYRTKEEIATRLGISKANLYNIYKELRQLDILTKDGINPKYRFRYLQFDEIRFKFTTGSNNKNT